MLDIEISETTAKCLPVTSKVAFAALIGAQPNPIEPPWLFTGMRPRSERTSANQPVLVIVEEEAQWSVVETRL